MSKTNRKKLDDFYQLFSWDDHVLILIDADPDALASAMALKRLLWRKTAHVAISNINAIKRPDNLAMVRLLGLKLTPIGKIDKEKYTRFALVDSQPGHKEIFEKFSFDVIIDHHPDTGPEAPFVDIRPKYGATASIMTEYIKTAKIKPAAKLATGLFHAIKTDTNNFAGKAFIEDVRAFQYLFRHVNIHLSKRIEQAEMKLDFLKYFKIALQVMQRTKGRVFAHLGRVTNPDICVLAADFFMKIDSINWSIVSGVYQKKLVIILRNDGIRRDAGKVAQESFGDLGYAGGHKNMARAEIPLAELTGLFNGETEKKVQQWIKSRVTKKAGKK
ncbi:Phosphoesterase [Candidatus Desulfarcum epimagneticum]|uniref:Phosphoesterase n=1 Tax=uncultured Desulfobacteraceae bacterium TaxID=218296 RepID=A0A484HJ20_9BACT|nr:Phosphoesterase [uncultured Desulfobacteraceae bacterium]